MSEDAGARWPGEWVVPAAARLAEDLLAAPGTAGRRWAHTQAVAARAAEAALVLPAEQVPALLAAAWLHDIGYAAAVRDTGFHPLDGARHLARRGWPPVVCALVAHHSAARVVARVRGLAAELAAYDLPEAVQGPVSDALTWADQTTGPDGTTVDLATRLSDVLRRHGPDSPNALAHPQRAPLLEQAVARTGDALVLRRVGLRAASS